MLKKLFFVLILSLTGNLCFSQVDTLVRFTQNFEFKDGIYFSIEEFKANCPKLKLTEIFDKKGRPAGRHWANAKKLYYQDNDSLQQVPLTEIWGYSDRGKVYVVKEGRQKRLQIIGSMCHIVITEEVREFVDQNYGRNRYNSRSIVREVNVEYLIDFENAEMIEFDMENFLNILIRDEQLYADFEKVKSKKARNQMKFHFLTKFNEKRPIYFSVSRCENE